MDLLWRLDGGELIGFFSVVGGLAVAVIAIIGGCWTASRKAEARTRQVEVEAALKQDMLNRGMSAQDIERVLNAGHVKPVAQAGGGG